MSDLNELHPLVRPKMVALVSAAHLELGVDLDAFDFWRDPKEQDELFYIGRNNAGEVVDPKAVVTNKRGGGSWHNVTYRTGKPCSLAFHVRPKLPGSRWLGFADSRLHTAAMKSMKADLTVAVELDNLSGAELIYCAVGLLGEQLGLRWGGRWRQPADFAHFELHPNGATLAQVQALIASQGDVTA